MRLAGALKTLLVLGFVVHLHHHFHGSPIDYAGLAIACGASWFGLPGPGEPLLIAAGILAAHHKLDIATVIVVAWFSAIAGAVIGWAIGLRMGRGVLERPGPLLRFRKGLLARGDEVFARYTVLAILLTPAPIAGIHGVRTAVFMATNVIGGAVWAAGLGLGAYYVGPSVIDVGQDLGLITTIGLVVLIALVLGGEMLRRRRGRGRRAAAHR